MNGGCHGICRNREGAKDGRRIRPAWEYNDPQKLSQLAAQTLSPQVDKGIKMPARSTLAAGVDWAKSVLSGNK